MERRLPRTIAESVERDDLSNDLFDRLTADPAFSGVDIDSLADPAHFIGRAPRQVDEFFAEIVEPIRARCGNVETRAEVSV